MRALGEQYIGTASGTRTISALSGREEAAHLALPGTGPGTASPFTGTQTVLPFPLPASLSDKGSYGARRRFRARLNFSWMMTQAPVDWSSDSSCPLEEDQVFPAPEPEAILPFVRSDATGSDSVSCRG